MANPAIQLRGLTKRFGSAVAVDSVSLEVEEGTTLALLGPSGCGKTTLLRLIAGFERPDAGSISIRGRAVVDGRLWVPPEKRRIGFVFQDYALFPHLTVLGNVLFGAKGRGRRARAMEMLELVGLADFAARMPHELSGGQQQRVALARALAPEPDLVLLDEPFSNLDAGLRRQVREELRRVLEVARATAIFVTHDQEEALSVGSRVAVMDGGRLLELDSPREIYLHPRSLEAARIVGVVNVLPCEVNGATVRCALGRLALARPCASGPGCVLLRPEFVELQPCAAAEGFPCSATVKGVRFHGNHQHVLVALDEGPELRARVAPGRSFAPGDRVVVRSTEPVVAVAQGSGAEASV